MDFIKKNWLTILIALGVIFLLWVIFRGCNSSNPHTEDKKYVDSLESVIKAEQQKQAKDSASYAIKIAAKDSAFNNVVNKLNATSSLAIKEQTERIRLAKLIQNAGIDTVLKFASCDSLASIVIDQGSVIETLQGLTDSLVIQHVEEMKIKDQRIAALDSAYKNVSDQALMIKSKYDPLFKDYGKQVKANKFNKTLSRVLGIAVLILGGIAYFK